MHPSDLAQSLTTITGQLWRHETISDDHHYWLICDADDARISVREDDGHLDIGGSFWESDTNLLDYVRSAAYKPRHNIGASAARSPLAVAREICRRLLPEFRADLARARALHAERLLEIQRSIQLAADLAALASGKVHRPAHRTDARSDFSAYHRDHNINLDGYTYGQDVTLTLRDLTPEQAARVVKALHS